MSLAKLSLARKNLIPGKNNNLFLQCTLSMMTFSFALFVIVFWSGTKGHKKGFRKRFCNIFSKVQLTTVYDYRIDSAHPLPWGLGEDSWAGWPEFFLAGGGGSPSPGIRAPWTDRSARQGSRRSLCTHNKILDNNQTPQIFYCDTIHTNLRVC